MVIESSKEDREKVRNKTVLLFSAGMDCVCVNQIFKPDLLLYIKHGNSYEKKELESIKRLIKLGAIDKKKLIIFDMGKWLGEKFERKDFIVLNRNYFFMGIASLFGETIMLASVKNDRSQDKDNPFYKLETKIFNHMWEEQHYCEERKFKIFSPVKNMTKTELVRKFLKCGGKKEWLWESWSCYGNNEKDCGRCKASIRKFVALKLNNIEPPKGYYINHPIKGNIELIKLLPKIRKNQWRGEGEDGDILKVMEIYNEKR